MSFYDPDELPFSSVEPKYKHTDLIQPDSIPILCDICQDGRRLVPYQETKLICPTCLDVVDPHFEYVKHAVTESTIDEESEYNTGELSYLDKYPTNMTETKKTRIRTKMEHDNAPDYVKREIEQIKWRGGVQVVKEHKKLSHTTSQNNT